jgi:putative DNA primase/helicase
MSSDIESAINEAANYAGDPEELLNELARLTPVEYEQRRKEAAKALDFRVNSLDRIVEARRAAATATDDTVVAPFMDLEPWPNPVDGADLLDALHECFLRHVILPDHAAEALALWIMHSHALDAASISPIMALESPQMQCGKSTTLNVIQLLARRPLPTSNITPAALFRAVERWQPTMVIDEADTFFRGNDELRGILNSGHNRFNAFVIRTVGDDYEPKHFSTWAAKAIALIGSLPGTLEDRSITVRLRRKRADEVVTRLRQDRPQEFVSLARQAARWARDNMDDLKRLDPVTPSELGDRAADNWRPLIAIADLAGGDWSERAHQAALALSVTATSEASIAIMLLDDIRALFVERDVDRIASAYIVSVLVEKEERPWPEYRKGKPITARQVASVLKPFEITPHSVRIGSMTPKGYELADFKDAFGRYLSDKSATAQQTQKITMLSATPSGPVANGVADRMVENSQCCGVADNFGMLMANSATGTEATEKTFCQACGNEIAEYDDSAIPFADGGWRHLRCYENGDIDNDPFAIPPFLDRRR